MGPTQDRVLALARAMGVGTFKTYNEGSNVQFLDGRAASTRPSPGCRTSPE